MCASAYGKIGIETTACKLTFVLDGIFEPRAIQTSSHLHDVGGVVFEFLGFDGCVEAVDVDGE